MRDPSGNCPWCIAALVSGGIDLGIQLYQNHGNWGCVDWWEVGGSMAMGAVGGFAGEFFNELRVENELVEETVRVGRWMSDTELGEMQDTGMVVESSLNGVTSVTSPPDAMAWMAQTEGRNFVEFDVPQSAIRASDGVTGKYMGLTVFLPRA